MKATAEPPRRSTQRRWRRSTCNGAGAARQRAAFSLLELILALGILCGAIVVLGELVRIGARNARIARDQTMAQLLCESHLAEIAAGTLPDAQGQGQTADAAGEWLLTVSSNPLDVEGMVAVSVTATQNLPPEGHPVSFTVVRWLTDPQVKLDEAEAKAAAEEEAAEKASEAASE